MKLSRLTCPSYKTQVQCLSLGTSPGLRCLPRPAWLSSLRAHLALYWSTNFTPFSFQAQTLLVPCGGPNVWSIASYQWMGVRLVSEWEMVENQMVLLCLSYGTGLQHRIWRMNTFWQLRTSRMTLCHTKHDAITSPQKPHQDAVTNMLSTLSYRVSCSHHSETSWWSSRFHPQASGFLPPGVQIGTFGPLLCGTGFC